MHETLQTENVPVLVLLVDDEENILKSIQRLLMDEEDIEIRTATSGEEGLALLPELANLGLIVSDQRMPGMTGALFLEKAREINPDASRIILTGYADVTAAVDAINRGGAWRYLAKPWNDVELVRIIREGLERYRIIIENRRLSALVLKQNQELEEWNRNLKDRVLQQTTAVRKKSEELQAALERSRASYLGVIDTLSNLVELRGKRTHQHSSNVAQMAVNAARELGIKDEELETIRIASLLHDIGEIGISERTLLIQPEVMKPEEFREYSQHPVRAQLLLDNIEELRPAAILIRHHHENMDGTGFPDKLSGENIPLGSRIIAFADQIDMAAMMCVDNIAEQSLARACLNVGTILDPELQRVFKKVARYCYFSDSKYSTAAPSGSSHEDATTVELELNTEKLRPGMVISRNLFSGTGLLLLHKGMKLDAGMIESVKRHYTLDPSGTGVYVTVTR
ncbi:MAG: HD domain-containing phosphohydrolase [Pelobacteraceae bacterium]